MDDPVNGPNLLGYRFPPSIIQYAVWLYHRFNLHRHSLCRRYFKLFRLRSFATWDTVTAPQLRNWTRIDLNEEVKLSVPSGGLSSSYGPVGDA
jgi:hypothetical protein